MGKVLYFFEAFDCPRGEGEFIVFSFYCTVVTKFAVSAYTSVGFSADQVNLKRSSICHGLVKFINIHSTVSLKMLRVIIPSYYKV